jgi:hypothetical protein
VIAFCAAVLGAQLGVLLARPGFWYWPFVDYPMYAEAYPAGSTFAYYELRAAPCGQDDASRVLGFEELHFMPHVLGALLRDASRAAAAGAAVEPAQQAAPQVERLTRALRALDGAPVCRAEIWSRSYRIGPDGLDAREVTPRLERSWGLVGARAISTARRGDR